MYEPAGLAADNLRWEFIPKAGLEKWLKLQIFFKLSIFFVKVVTKVGVFIRTREWRLE